MSLNVWTLCVINGFVPSCPLTPAPDHSVTGHWSFVCSCRPLNCTTFVCGLEAVRGACRINICFCGNMRNISLMPLWHKCKHCTHTPAHTRIHIRTHTHTHAYIYSFWCGPTSNSCQDLLMKTNFMYPLYITLCVSTVIKCLYLQNNIVYVSAHKLCHSHAHDLTPFLSLSTPYLLMVHTHTHHGHTHWGGPERMSGVQDWC